MNDQQSQSTFTQDDSYVNSYQPPQMADDTTAQAPVAADQQVEPAAVAAANNTPVADEQPQQASGSSQTLEEQNVFFLLVVDKSNPQEKESFLDELQQVIWEDFLESDVKLLITQEETKQLEELMQKPDMPEEEKQEKIVVFLEKIIPDLEEIMLEKAVELKGDMFKERILGLKEFYATDAEKLTAVNKAEDLMSQNLWLDSATVLNQLQ